MKALIFAAGLGTRLRPLTDSMPKALVPVGGKALIGHVAEKLKASGVSEIVVNIHHFPEQMRRWAASQTLGIPVTLSDESDRLLETGGGILHARGLLYGDGGFLVHNVDILSNLDIPAFVASVRKDSLATLVVSERKSSRYLLFDADMRMAGWTNTLTGEVRSPYPDIDPDRCRKLAFAGIHYISDSIFDVLERQKAGDRFSITDFYVDVCDRYDIRAFVPDDFRMMDVGKAETLSVAEAFCADLV